MNIDPEALYQSLATQEPTPLAALPRTHGMYALYDHEGVMRYVGITMNDQSGFYGRIYQRHVAGSESRSHKFSHAYNTGRMWRAARDSRPDAKLSKGLRTAFVRRFCRATVIEVPIARHADLPLLERTVQRLAPAGQLTWIDARGFEPIDEPRALVDLLLAELAYTSDRVEALLRQAALHSARPR
ncbi:hypothetical protein [Chenggangzhangella methanolivorans]|uniref:GIY-YIG domain-containing protein n=1 Tax=Chenggangzhangella methanolivorans TaxID=1437009 RepID=A0A9E6UKP8_9HYPH|nr:hypothetical protein [Chenggangzhangella methanolivorans]QZN99611.1 hypothetical protein K6K41_23410 [Chenggangzhangella methanolivorans]